MNPIISKFWSKVNKQEQKFMNYDFFMGKIRIKLKTIELNKILVF